MANALPAITHKNFENKIFIVSTTAINFKDLERYFMDEFSLEEPNFPEGTIFYIISGFHGYEKGKLGGTDFELSQDFNVTMMRNLKKFCGRSSCQECNDLRFGECNFPSVWKKMKYQHNAITLSTEKIRGVTKAYKLDEDSENKLIELSENLIKQDKPSCLIFASCYSFYSEICHIMGKYGILTAVEMQRDRGNLTNGKAYLLDEQQQQIIHAVRKVLMNVFI